MRIAGKQELTVPLRLDLQSLYLSIHFFAEGISLSTDVVDAKELY